jgi:peptide/nickel transport system substrate-binding protein
MKKKNLTVLLASIMVLSTLATGCGKSNAPADDVKKGDLTSKLTDITKASDPSKLPDVAKNRKDTIVVGIDAPDGVFNPIYMESAYDGYVSNVIFNSLCDPDSEGNMVAALAKSWKISTDGLKYTFTLNKDIKFTDGTAFTADDVVFTYTALCDPSYTGPSDAASWNIKGYKEFNKGTATTVEGIKKIDAETVEFTLDKPNASAMYTLGGAGILSKNYYGKDYKKGDLKSVEALHKQPMGTGQYKFVTYKEGQEVDLVANDKYFRGAPKVKNLIFKVTTEATKIQLLTTGEIDMDMVTVNSENVAQVKSPGFLDIQMFPTNGYGYIGMNLKNPMFKDQKVRQALTYGLNRKQVVETVYKGYADVCNEPTSKVSWTYTDDVNKYDFDLKKAASLLDEAGWVKGADGIRAKDGKKFEIHFLASTPNAVNDVIIPIAKENYLALGIKFIPETLEFNAINKRKTAGDFEMFFMAWGLTADPDQTGVFGSKGAQNKTGYSNAKVDELLAKGLLENDLAKRKVVYQDLYKEVNTDLPYIFMYQRRDMWAVSSRIEGMTITPYKDFTYDMWKVSIK